MIRGSVFFIEIVFGSSYVPHRVLHAFVLSVSVISWIFPFPRTQLDGGICFHPFEEHCDFFADSHVLALYDVFVGTHWGTAKGILTPFFIHRDSFAKVPLYWFWHISLAMLVIIGLPLTIHFLGSDKIFSRLTDTQTLLLNTSFPTVVTDLAPHRSIWYSYSKDFLNALLSKSSLIARLVLGYRHTIVVMIDMITIIRRVDMSDTQVITTKIKHLFGYDPLYLLLSLHKK